MLMGHEDIWMNSGASGSKSDNFFAINPGFSFCYCKNLSVLHVQMTSVAVNHGRSSNMVMELATNSGTF